MMARRLLLALALNVAAIAAADGIELAMGSETPSLLAPALSPNPEPAPVTRATRPASGVCALAADTIRRPWRAWS